MPASRRGLRAAIAGCRLAIAGLLASGLLAAGCDTLDGVPRAGEPRSLAGDLATRLEATDARTYTAVYQITGGGQATAAKAVDPSRVAYTYPGGKLIMSPAELIDCRTSGTATRCTVTPVASPDPGPDPALFAELIKHGMVPPPVVVGLLNATALDPDAEVAQRDTTVAGQHATCVSVAGVDNAAASTFEVCVTTDGVLGSFIGVVHGTQVELALTQYQGSVAEDAFAPPANATIVRR